VAFAVNFWAWSLLSPLAPRYQELLGLSPLAVSVMVAVPVIVGSLGRIPSAPSPTATAAASSSRCCRS
jgi:NNP family nitrate/nitrite transporter-like MFS transporter